MNKSPFLNASAAAAYVIVIVFVMNGLSTLATPKGGNILVPMVVLGLFVLSAAVMGFLFLYEPFKLHFEDRKQEALAFLAKTVGSFACFVALFIAAFLFTTLKG